MRSARGIGWSRARPSSCKSHLLRIWNVHMLTRPQHRIDEDGDGDSLTTGWCHQEAGAQGRGKYLCCYNACSFLSANISSGQMQSGNGLSRIRGGRDGRGVDATKKNGKVGLVLIPAVDNDFAFEYRRSRSVERFNSDFIYFYFTLFQS